MHSYCNYCKTLQRSWYYFDTFRPSLHTSNKDTPHIIPKLEIPCVPSIRVIFLLLLNGSMVCPNHSCVHVTQIIATLASVLRSWLLTLYSWWWLDKYSPGYTWIFCILGGTSTVLHYKPQQCPLSRSTMVDRVGLGTRQKAT